MSENNGNAPRAWRLQSGFAAKARQAIRERRRKHPFRLVAQVCEKYLRAYYNEGLFDFAINGEAFALDCFARWACGRETVLYDVGANQGEWAAEALHKLPSARVQSFEILPPIADAFAARLGDDARVTLHRLGLSDAAGAVDVTWNTLHHTTSAIDYRGTDAFGHELQVVRCPVNTLDSVIADGMPAPDFLKIDTEGHDAAVLRGASALLSSAQAPAMIQFEYGDTWLPAQETLAHCQQQLEIYGYKVGRLYPNYVDFKTYAYADDHFRMGNMIAVRDAQLAQLLKG